MLSLETVKTMANDGWLEIEIEGFVLFLFIGSMEKYSFFNVGHRWSRVIKVSMEYVLHKCRGMLFIYLFIYYLFIIYFSYIL